MQTKIDEQDEYREGLKKTARNSIISQLLEYDFTLAELTSIEELMDKSRGF